MRLHVRTLATLPSRSVYIGCSGAVLLLVFFVWISSSPGQTPLPVVDGVDARALRIQCRELLEAMAKIKASMPQETERQLRELIKEEKNISDASTAKIQKLLNDQCLIGVSINPESRVKAARGSRSAELVAGNESVVLIRVLNEAGVTHALSLEGPQIIGPRENAKERWLHATVYPEHPSRQKL